MQRSDTKAHPRSFRPTKQADRLLGWARRHTRKSITRIIDECIVAKLTSDKEAA